MGDGQSENKPLLRDGRYKFVMTADDSTDTILCDYCC